MKECDNQTAKGIEAELQSALKAFEEAKKQKVKADEVFNVAAAEVATLAMELSQVRIGDKLNPRKHTTTNSVSGGKLENQTIGGFAVGDLVARAKRDCARGKVVGLFPFTKRVRVKFDDRQIPGNYLPQNLRKL